MEQVAVLLKSYAGDFDLAERLIRSYHEFNADGLKLFIVVPHEDRARFASMAGQEATVISELEFEEHLVTEPVHGIRPGYINQQIVKLAFWELETTHNYFCVDSDAVFIRPFYASDFMYDETTPYTVLVEDNDLKVDPTYFAQHWQGREASLRTIQAEIGLIDRRLLTAHGHQVMAAKVLRSFHEDFVRPRGWDYAEALTIAPYEFSWYAFWLQKAFPESIRFREPLVKVFHHPGQYLEAHVRGLTITDLARSYIALVVNSNFSRNWASTTPLARRYDILAEQVPLKTLAKAAGTRAFRQFDVKRRVVEAWAAVRRSRWSAR